MTEFAMNPIAPTGRVSPWFTLPWKTADSHVNGDAEKVLRAAEKALLHYRDTETAKGSSHQQIANTIQLLLQTYNNPRDRQIADRLIALEMDAVEEGEEILAGSVIQFRDFFLMHRQLGLPKITLTPDGTLRVRWIRGEGNFFAIEFTGKPLLKLVAEAPRKPGVIANHFSSEPIERVIEFALAIGISLE
jgi:hypothetical protein